MANKKGTRKTRRPKSKFIGTVVKEFKKKDKTYKVGEAYDAIEQGSYTYLITAGYIVGKI